MKKLLSLILLWIVPTVSIAATTFVWQQPSKNVDGSALTDLTGNKVYCGTAAGTYTIIKDAGLPAPTGAEARYPISSVITSDGVYYCTVTAYDGNGNESGKSNEVIFPLDSKSPDVVDGLHTE